MLPIAACFGPATVYEIYYGVLLWPVVLVICGILQRRANDLPQQTCFSGPMLRYSGVSMTRHNRPLHCPHLDLIFLLFFFLSLFIFSAFSFLASLPHTHTHTLSLSLSHPLSLKHFENLLTVSSHYNKKCLLHQVLIQQNMCIVVLDKILHLQLKMIAIVT